MIATIVAIKIIVIVNIDIMIIIIIIAINYNHIKVEAIHITTGFDTFSLRDNTFGNINHSKEVKPLLDIIDSIMVKCFMDSKNFNPNDLKDNY